MRKLTEENINEQVAKNRIDWSENKVLDNINFAKLNSKDIMNLMLSCIDDMKSTSEYLLKKLQTSEKKNIKEITETLDEYDIELENLEKLIQSNVTTKTRFNKLNEFDWFNDDKAKLHENISTLKNKIGRNDSFDNNTIHTR